MEFLKLLKFKMYFYTFVTLWHFFFFLKLNFNKDTSNKIPRVGSIILTDPSPLTITIKFLFTLQHNSNYIENILLKYIDNNLNSQNIFFTLIAYKHANIRFVCRQERNELNLDLYASICMASSKIWRWYDDDEDIMTFQGHRIFLRI